MYKVDCWDYWIHDPKWDECRKCEAYSYEACSGKHYRDACEGEQEYTEDACGWWYKDSQDSEKYWVTCDQIYNDVEWEECDYY